MSLSQTASGYISNGGESAKILFGPGNSPTTGWTPLIPFTGTLSGLSLLYERDSNNYSFPIQSQSPTGYSLDGSFLEVSVLLPEIILSTDSNIEISGIQLTFLDPGNNITGEINSPILINNNSEVTFTETNNTFQIFNSKITDIRPIGSDNTVLVADSTKPNGVTWKTVDFANIALPVQITNISLLNASPIVGSGINNFLFSIFYNNNSVTGVNIIISHLSQTVFNQNFEVDFSSVTNPDLLFSILTVTGLFYPTGFNNINIVATVFSPGFQHSKSLTLNAANYIRYGSGIVNPTINSSFIASLPSFIVSNDINQRLNWIDIPSGNHYYIATRSAFSGSNHPFFEDANLRMIGGFSPVATSISYTNNAGYTENYNVYRSNKPWLGPTKINIVSSGNV
jgi:hypothetical protein